MTQENKNFAQGQNETSQPEAVVWKPNYKWLAKVAGIILAFVIVLFFTLNIVLKPYMRNIPSEITPWLNNGGAQTQTVR
ncbi:hypothetical protein [Endomicrobium proavitum]|uniref:Putative ABC transporter membrane protein n=1 Tax=Endomicrobium proavitum TaxID=1408281 RepID=A0A0G3WGL5_9BACT|nr:hypothetical protein [Endomicrobium proavitum]AKL97458.1 putative ABC transporter membrane protein [Endomicrobium proavitum]